MNFVKGILLLSRIVKSSFVFMSEELCIHPPNCYLLIVNKINEDYDLRDDMNKI